MESIKKFWWIILLGLLLRLVVAAFTFHPDVRILNFTTAIFFREQSLNPYDFVTSLGPDDPRKKIFSAETPDDLPLQYFIHLPIDLLTRPFIDQKIESQFLLDNTKLLGNPLFNLHLLLTKLPLVLLDVLLGLILCFVVSQKLYKKMLIFWMFNPFDIWATAAIGQVDILPTFFVVLALILIIRNKLSLSALSLGVGAALKSFPFLIAPFLIFLARSWGERLKLLILIILPWVISVAPFLPSPIFRANALFAPQMDKILYAKLPLSGGEAIYIVIAILVVLYLLYLQKNRNGEDFLKFSTSGLLLTLAFTHFHIQWFLWVMPFLLIFLVRGLKQSQLFSLWLMFILVVIMLFLFEASLQVRLFAPAIPDLNLANGLAESLSQDKLGMLKNLIASIFAASAIFFIFSILKNTSSDVPHIK